MKKISNQFKLIFLFLFNTLSRIFFFLIWISNKYKSNSVYVLNQKDVFINEYTSYTFHFLCICMYKRDLKKNKNKQNSHLDDEIVNSGKHSIQTTLNSTTMKTNTNGCCYINKVIICMYSISLVVVWIVYFLLFQFLKCIKRIHLFY